MNETTEQLLKQIEELQNICKANHPNTKAWQDASDKLQPLFEEMAKRQREGKL